MINWENVDWGSNTATSSAYVNTNSLNTAIDFNCTADNFKIDNVSINDFVDKKIKESAVKKPEVPVDTKTMLDVSNGKIAVKYYKDGFFSSKRNIMSDIKDVQVYNNVVIVVFADGTTTKAVLDAEDEFSLEQGISICITKKLLGNDGESVYNKLIKRALRVVKQKEDAALEEHDKKMEEKRKKEAATKRHQKKMLKKREEAIEIQKEAYIRAMMQLKEVENDEKNIGA